ncbi:Gamma-soluble NSF attachment protein [Geodia barretti]|uniref:Gamma-soluble NSF attachment protein n=1 Tax=Geodia barretti TaxID=519541 RepID=A0AA35RQP3_GEOBA|nr:Gamma-soluble NSF attachment protein [Geodia barretti]
MYILLQEMKQMEQAAMLLETASHYYHESGHGDTAGQVLTKAAKLVDPVNPLRAVDYHLACAELHLVEDKQREATKATRNAVNMAARARDLDKLKEVLEKLRALYEELNMHKQLWNVAAIELVLHLHRDDTVAANDTVVDAAKIPGFLESDERPAMERLCDAFQERDGDAVVEACGGVVFRSMETDVAKLALDLKKKFEYSSPTHTASTSKPSSSSSSTGPSSTKSPPPSASTVTAVSSAGSGRFADMKSELFGGGTTSGEDRENTKQKQPVIEETVESQGDKIERASEEEREEGERVARAEMTETAYGGALPDNTRILHCFALTRADVNSITSLCLSE